MGRKQTAVQFGAGNIGRGFIAQLFHEAGLEVVFVDVAPHIVEALKSRGEYAISIVGPGARHVPISGVRAVDGRDRAQVASEVAECAVACTAVGVDALPRIAPALAAGLLERFRASGGPLNVLVCENLLDAAGALRSLVEADLPDDNRDAVLSQTGFVQAVVSRMVPIQDDAAQDPLAIRVEAYRRLPVDGSALVSSLPAALVRAGVEPVDNFSAQVERKLYTHNCGHAALGYLGWHANYRFAHEALEDETIRRTVGSVLAETGEALVRKHGFDRAEHLAHVEDLLVRFSNRALGDTCCRLARDPLRKLAPGDRLVGAARLCESQGVTSAALPQVIAAAIRFDSGQDPSSQRLQEMLRQRGPMKALREISGIDASEPLGLAIQRCLLGS